MRFPHFVEVERVLAKSAISELLPAQCLEALAIATRNHRWDRTFQKVFPCVVLYRAAPAPSSGLPRQWFVGYLDRMAATTLSLSFPEPDIAVLSLDDPDSSANVLSRHVLDTLEHHLNALDQRRDLAGLVIRSAKPGMFIAGADLKEFAASLDAPKDEVAGYSRRGQQLFGRLASANYVTVAAIDGTCVGGGAELAMWCDRRIFTNGDKTAYGFPEVKLGLFPGWGGTARLPRMIGLSNAVELVTGGESIDSTAAALLGLANDVVAASTSSADVLLAAAIRMIRTEQVSNDYRRDRDRWASPFNISDTELGFLGATASAYIQQQTKGHYPAPLAALELMLGAAGVDLKTACQMEAERFAQLFGSPINRALKRLLS